MKNNLSVLIVDDSIDTLRLTGMVFHRGGYEVHTARSGAEALAKIASLQPSLLILDVMMPDMSGLELCRQLRANPGTAWLPIIMVSAKGFVDDRVTGFQAGADDYVPKPADPQELLARAKALLHRASYGQKPAAKTIAVVGAKGGVGATTVAINLAATLVMQSSSVILAELRPDRGSADVYLNLEVAQDLGDLLALEADKLTGEQVIRSLARHETGLQLLAASHGSGQELTPEHGQKILSALQQQAEYLVLDLPAVTAPATRPMLENSDHILLVTEPERLSVACAKRDLESLKQWGLRSQTHVVTVARTPVEVALSRGEVEQGLSSGGAGERPSWPGSSAAANDAAPVTVSFQIPEAAETLAEALRRHEPLVVAMPNLVVAKLFKDMVQTLLEKEAPVAATPG
jgi:DNA-binding response OmpR family regulator